jgi:hypothetical protein
MFQPSVGTVQNVKQRKAAGTERSKTEVEAGARYVE